MPRPGVVCEDPPYLVTVCGFDDDHAPCIIGERPAKTNEPIGVKTIDKCRMIIPIILLPHRASHIPVRAMGREHRKCLLHLTPFCPE